MSFRHPFQKIFCMTPPGGQTDILLAAAGPNIISLDLQDGTLLDKWPTVSEPDEPFGEAPVEAENGNHEDGQPPQKKQKLADESRDEASRESSISIEIVAERLKGQRRRKKLANAKLPNISHILASSDQQYLIVVTSDDKCIRVFQISSSGRLKVLSERNMPKRLCAIVLSPDESALLAGDKFGDVYCLPLHPTTAKEPLSPQPTKPATDFKPSASEFTVHTKGNREALRQQQLHKMANTRKEGPSFEHKLLLGHVSLLTDLITVSINVDGKPRQYILTADRDEHIRVSRGLPQMPIIETHCLGHKDFVSKICLLPWQPNILLAGSGEPSLRFFEWRRGRPLGDAMLAGNITEDIASIVSDVSGERLSGKLAVSGIWTMQCGGALSKTSERIGMILVAIEGLPLLLSYKKALDEDFQYLELIKLRGNALDVAVLREHATILVSVDNVHLPGSMRNRRSEGVAPQVQFQSFILYSPGEKEPVSGLHSTSGNTGRLLWHPSALAEKLNGTVEKDEDPTLTPEIPSEPSSKAIYSPLGEFLYGLENLRKKTGNDLENPEEMEEAELQE